METPNTTEALVKSSGTGLAFKQQVNLPLLRSSVSAINLRLITDLV